MAKTAAEKAADKRRREQFSNNPLWPEYRELRRRRGEGYLPPEDFKRLQYLTQVFAVRV